MSIWVYSDRVFDEKLIRDGIDKEICPFCKTKMTHLHSKIRALGSRTGSRYRREDINVKVCNTCGWWTVKKSHYLRNKHGRCSHIPKVGHRLYGNVAILRNLNLANISTPIQEVRDYLTARYEQRYCVHPKIFEETVASVFRDLGYHSRVTAYSGDGGIDVILDGEDHIEIGVQVKRYKDSISVEQIRSFTGALWLNGITRGIYVTTSRFEAGASRLTSLARLKGMQIELIDAPRFYDALKIAQRNVYECKEELLEYINDKPLILLNQGGKW